MARVLVVEDEVIIQEVIVETLSNEFEVTCVGSRALALNTIKNQQFDIFLLDVNLPDGTGFEICGALKDSERTRSKPVLFLTGLNDAENRVQGFNLGADDYILKPFNPRELLARVRVRSRVNWSENKSLFGQVRVGWDIQKVFVRTGEAERDIFVTPLEFRMVAFFCRSVNEVVSRDQLRKEAWGKDLNVGSRSVDKHVCSLRAKLGECGAYLETVPGAGYRFNPGRAA